jgi:hypothetical protein
MTAIQQKFAGAAEAAVNPITQLKNRIGDLFQAIGDALVPNTENFLIASERAVASLIGWIERNPELTQTIVALTTALGAILLVLGPLALAGLALSAAFSPVTLIVLGLTAAIAAGILIWKNWDLIVADFKIGMIDLFMPLKKLGIFISEVRLKIAEWTGVNKEAVDQMKQNIDTYKDELRQMEESRQVHVDTINSRKQKNREFMDNIKDVTSTFTTGTEDVVEGYEEQADAAITSTDTQIEAVQEKAKAVISWEDFIAGENKRVTREKLKAAQDAIEEELKAYRARTDARLREEEKLDKALDRAMLKLDETVQVFNESGASITDVLTDWAEHAGMTTGEFRDHLDGLNLDLSDSKVVFEAFGKDTGIVLKDWADGFKNAADTAGSSLDGLKDKTTGLGSTIKDQLSGASSDKDKTTTDVPKGKVYKSWDEMLADQKAMAASTADPAVVSAEDAIRANLKEQGIRQQDLNKYVDDLRKHAKSGREYYHDYTYPNAGDDDVKNIAASFAKQNPAGAIRDIYNAIAQGVDQFAMGGVSRGGLAIVGERGPELVSLPGGSRVHPSGVGSNTFIFNGAVYGVEDLKRVVVEAVRDHAVSGGFSGVFAGA